MSYFLGTGCLGLEIFGLMYFGARDFLIMGREIFGARNFWGEFFLGARGNWGEGEKGRNIFGA